MCLTARSYRVGGGRTLETYTAGNTTGQGYNLQVLVDQAGQIFYISEPLPGSTHDITAHKKHWFIRSYATLTSCRG